MSRQVFIFWRDEKSTWVSEFFGGEKKILGEIVTIAIVDVIGLKSVSGDKASDDVG